MAKPIARVGGLTAQHSENYQNRIRGPYPSKQLEPDELQTIGNWLKGTAKQRFEQLCEYMEGRHTWEELVDYWQRLLPKA